MNILFLIIHILIPIESGNNPNPPPGDNGKAIGILQIHPIMVEEVNRIIGKRRYILKDRSNRTKSIEMCCIFLRHQLTRKPSATALQLCQSWNSGSINRSSTINYKQKLIKRLK